MGVKGLPYYAAINRSKIYKNVFIPELASAGWITGRPILVVDGMSFINTICRKEKEWVYGGQWKEFVHKLKEYVDKFRQFEIDLVFFFDGATRESKRYEWALRRKNQLLKTDDIFNYIKCEKVQPPHSMFFLPTDICGFSRYILKYECQCEIYVSILEADQEISDYANRNHNCFGILTEDSDFLIYDTKPYLSMKHLNMDDLTTIMYDRHALAKIIGLDISLLPLFSCLLGNDIISIEDIRLFHRSLCGNSNRNYNRIPNIEELVPKIVKLIHSYRWTAKETRHIAAIMNIDEDILIQGLAVYSSCVEDHDKCYTPGDDPVSIARDIAINGKGSYKIHSLIETHSYNEGVILEDRNNEEIRSSAIIYREIRKKLYRILFQSKNVIVKEWCPYHGNSLEEPELIQFEEIDYEGSILSLENLWSIQPDLFDQQWKIFRWCIGVSISASRLKKIPEKYMVLCCILNFLMLRPELTGIALWEIAAFICQAISPYSRDVNKIRKVIINSVDSRAVQLAALFIRGVRHAEEVGTVCIQFFSHYYLMPWHFFDGKLFHHYYLMAKNGASLKTMCDNQEKILRLFDNVYRVIQKNTPFPLTISKESLLKLIN